MASHNNAVHLLAGGLGGTVGAIVTCPLEVVKTRLQSSVANFLPLAGQHVRPALSFVPHHQYASIGTNYGLNTVMLSAESSVIQKPRPLGVLLCLRHIMETEGTRALFRGLGPNLVGVAPSRAIYFFSYAKAKSYLNSVMSPDTPLVHVMSAMTAGFMASTATNPIWFVKTRMQLDQKKNDSKRCYNCVRNVYQTMGFRGFYKGITASYFGITETVIHFVIYEAIKAKLFAYSCHDPHTNKKDHSMMYTTFLECMLAGAISKTFATCIAYPHEVIRTRLRQEGNKYRSFLQTLILVAKEEGGAALYRGLATQLMRQIPNTAIMMSTYEAVVYFMSDTDG